MPKEGKTKTIKYHSGQIKAGYVILKAGIFDVNRLYTGGRCCDRPK